MYITVRIISAISTNLRKHFSGFNTKLCYYDFYIERTDILAQKKITPVKFVHK